MPPTRDRVDRRRPRVVARPLLAHSSSLATRQAPHPRQPRLVLRQVPRRVPRRERVVPLQGLEPAVVQLLELERLPVPPVRGRRLVKLM